MKKIMSLIFILFLMFARAQDNIIFEAKPKKQTQFGKYKYSLKYEYNYQPEGKLFSYSEVLIKGNRKQYIGHFVYQLKSSTEIQISSDNPPPIQIENKILQNYNSFYNEEKKQIIVTTYFYNDKENIDKEVKTLQQAKKGFFYVKEKLIYLKNGEIKEEKNMQEKLKFHKIPF